LVDGATAGLARFGRETVFGGRGGGRTTFGAVVPDVFVEDASFAGDVLTPAVSFRNVDEIVAWS
jgi:hypothetical protein